MNAIKSTLILALSGSFFLANAQGTEMMPGNVKSAMVSQPGIAEMQLPSIVQIATGNEAFSTLATALGAAGLVETLEGTGPFTVFAPTNDAFQKLPAGTVESLLKPESKQALGGILTYHVVAGKVMAADVVKAIQENNNAFSVKTVNGEALTFSLDGGAVMVTDAKGNSAKVTATDVEASNGAVHVIDSVLLPN